MSEARGRKFDAGDSRLEAGGWQFGERGGVGKGWAGKIEKSLDFVHKKNE